MSYPKVYNLDHKAVKEILSSPVVIQEKVDGSQFSFGLLGDPPTLTIRSRSADISLDNKPIIFAKAVETVRNLYEVYALTTGWTYYGEAFQKPKHHTLTYGRVPEGNVILFDIMVGEQDFLPPEEVVQESQSLGLEVVPTIYYDMVDDLPALKNFLEYESILGNTKVEGIVIKNYAMFGADKKVLMAKWVREEFKEMHKREWTPGPNIVEQLVATLKTEARWEKAIAHLREQGKLQEAVQDIGPIIREVCTDVHEEEQDFIKEKLFEHFWKQINKQLTRGLPEWYKEKLARTAFPETTPKPASDQDGTI